MEAGSTWRDAAWRTAALSADRRGGIAAFVEKRKPAWPGATDLKMIADRPGQPVTLTVT